MRNRKLHLALMLTVACQLGTHATAENWPQWRGPTLNGLSSDVNLPLTWTKTENVVWRLPLPAFSGSTPIVWQDRIFLNIADQKNLFLWAVDRNTGRPVWQKHLSGGNHKQQKQNMSSPSPVTDGRNVWTITGTGMLKAFDFDGNELWARDIQKEYGRFGLNYGYASSPLLYGDSIYLQVIHGMQTDDPSYILRIAKVSGKTLWKVERLTAAIRESPDSHTTPVLFQGEATTEIVITGGDVVTGHDIATGKEAWRASGLNPTNDPFYRIIASPVVLGQMVYAPTREKPLLALRAGGRGDVTRSHLVWSFESGPDVPSPVTDGVYFYVVRDNGVMFCLDAQTGKTVYGPQRLRPGTYSGSPVLADGKVYVTNEDGVTIVVRAGPKFEVLAENDLGEYTLSSPAISGDQLFIRTESALYAIGGRAGQQ